MQIAVTGSSGLIGTALRSALEMSGHGVLRVVRGGPSASDAIRWDPNAGAIDAEGLEGIDGVVHLAGESIGSARWTQEQKDRILDSRVVGTQLLASTLAGLDNPPKVMVSGSAVGYYGVRGDEVLTEEDPPGTGFLAEVVVRWEAATAPAAAAGIRVPLIRSGVVLSREGGALQRMLLPFKLGLGGRLGSGGQYWSWISIQDEVSAIVHVLEDERIAGPINLTAPQPTPQAEFAQTLAHVLHRPAVLPTPTFPLKALYGSELVEQMLTGGQRVVPRKLEESGYTFLHPDLESALKAVLSTAP